MMKKPNFLVIVIMGTHNLRSVHLGLLKQRLILLHGGGYYLECVQRGILQADVMDKMGLPGYFRAHHDYYRIGWPVD